MSSWLGDWPRLFSEGQCSVFTVLLLSFFLVCIFLLLLVLVCCRENTAKGPGHRYHQSKIVHPWILLLHDDMAPNSRPRCEYSFRSQAVTTQAICFGGLAQNGTKLREDLKVIYRKRGCMTKNVLICWFDILLWHIWSV